MCLAYHYWHPLFDNTRLLTGNLCKRIAQKLCMVKTYIGNDAQVGRYHISAVQPSAHSYLHHCHIHLLRGEIVECQTHRHLEETQLQRLHKFFVLLYKVHHRLPGYLLSVYAYPLTEINQMGRSIQSYLIACLHQYRAEHVRHRTLPVGSCHMQRPEPPLGMSQMVHQFLRVGNIGLICRLPYPVVHGQTVKHIVECLLISHHFFFFSSASGPSCEACLYSFISWV